MNRFILLFGILLLASCTNSDNKNISQNSVTEYASILNNKELVNPFFTNDYCDSVITTVALNQVEKLIVVENLDTLVVELFHIPEWSDPGDFLKIKIADMAGVVKLETNNFDGWVKHRFPPEVISESLISSDYAALLENKTGKQLLLFGYTYASQPGLLTVIDLFPEAKVVFNRNYEIRSIAKIENGYMNFVGSANGVDTRTLDFQEMKLK